MVLTRPNIDFRDSIIGPSLQPRSWRDQVGVPSIFSRGSETPQEVSGAEEFASLYSLDGSPGSLFVQQAMANGLSNFTICRASASSSPSSATIKFSSTSPTVAPRIGYTVSGNTLIPSPNRTTGFQLTLNYLSDAITINSLYSKVRTKNTLVDHPTFEGQGRFKFYVTKAVEGNSSLPALSESTLSISVLATSIAGYQIALIAKNAANLSTLEELLQPGFSLVKISETASDKVLIASNLLDLSATHYGLLLRSELKHSNSIVGKIAFSTNAQAAGEGDLVIDNLVTGDTLDALPANTNPTFLKSMVLSINGKLYTQRIDPVLVDNGGTQITSFGGTSVSTIIDGAAGDDIIGDELYTGAETNVGDSTRGYRFSLNEVLPALNQNTVAALLPSVLSVGDSENKQITIQGLLKPEQINGSYKLSIGDKLFTIASVTQVTAAVSPNNTIGRLIVVVNEDIDGVTAGQIVDFILPTTADYKIKFPNKAQYVIGYHFDTPNFTTSTVGDLYYTQQEVYNDGYDNFNIDSYFLLNEDSGGVYRTFNFQELSNTGISLTEPTKLNNGGVGIEILWGEENQVKLPLEVGGQFFVPFAKTSVLVGAKTSAEEESYQDGTTLVEVLQDLKTAIEISNTASDLVTVTDLDDVSISPSITLLSSVEGKQSNRISWKLQRYQTAPVEDAVLNSPVGVYDTYYNFTGGVDGAQFASRDLYAADGTLLWRLVALTPGSHGNNLKYSVRDQKVNRKFGSFQLEVQDLNSNSVTADSKKVFIVDSGNIDTNTGRSLAFTSSSSTQAYFIPAVRLSAAETSVDTTKRVFKLTPQRLAPPLQSISTAFGTGLTSFTAQGLSTLTQVSLTGGSNTSSEGAQATAGLVAGLIKAIKQLEEYNIAVLVLPGISYGDPTFQPVFDAAKASVENSTVESGLRTAVFELPANISPERAGLFREQLNSERVVLVTGRQLMKTLTNQLVPNVGSSGSYVGYNYTRSPHISPAASYPGNLVRGVSSVDTKSNSDYLDKMAINGVEVLVSDQNAGGFRFSNGLTTSDHPVYRYASIVRLLDQVKSDLYINLQWVRSRPNNTLLQNDAATACDAYLQTKFREGWFTKLDSTICSSINNTQRDQQAGRLNIRIRLTPTFPADRILVDTVLDLTEDFSLQTAI